MGGLIEYGDISLVSLEEFKQDYTKYIDNAKDKRDRLHEFNI